MNTLHTLSYPLAITMWDFSWLERRWPGAGYESWDQALDELVERGYDAVRIDAYPHLVAHDPRRTWELLPEWTQNAWGAPARCRVQILPALLIFLEKCARRGVKVGLSTWFRQDLDDLRLRVRTPADHAAIWLATLEHIAAAGLLESVLYVDLCNEFPMRPWAPFLYTDLPDEAPNFSPADPDIGAWMRQSVEAVRARYPALALCHSLCHDLELGRTFDVEAFDLLELHLWMTQFTDFYERVGYRFERFEPTGYDRLALLGERLYWENAPAYQAALAGGIGRMAAWARAVRKPLVTTECWGPVDYKDWPLLDWGWVKDICAFGVRAAVREGQWAAIATSNFCGPQFVGMWRDLPWHRMLTEHIHQGALPPVS